MIIPVDLWRGEDGLRVIKRTGNSILMVDFDIFRAKKVRFRYLDL